MPDTTHQEGAGQTEVAGQHKTFFEIISKKNFFDHEWQANKRLQDRQKEILEAFPDKEALIVHLVEHYRRNYQRETEYAQKTGREVKHSDPHIVIRGEIFEKLVATENRIHNLSAEARGLTPQEKLPEHQQMEDEFTDFLRQPDKYGFPDLWPMRNPDLSFVESRSEDLMVLTGTGEAKSAQALDYRAYQQMRPDGLRKTLEQSMMSINQLDSEEAEKRGLHGFGKQGKKIMMIQKFTQFVIMCRDIPFNDPDKLVKRENFQRQRDFDDFRLMLLGVHPESKVKLVHSSFSEDEVTTIFRSVMPEVQRQIAQQPL